jgi:hypothetical protein
LALRRNHIGHTPCHVINGRCQWRAASHGVRARRSESAMRIELIGGRLKLLDASKPPKHERQRVSGGRWGLAARFPRYRVMPKRRFCVLPIYNVGVARGRNNVPFTEADSGTYCLKRPDRALTQAHVGNIEVHCDRVIGLDGGHGSAQILACAQTAGVDATFGLDNPRIFSHHGLEHTLPAFRDTGTSS